MKRIAAFSLISLICIVTAVWVVGCADKGPQNFPGPGDMSASMPDGGYPVSDQGSSCAIVDVTPVNAVVGATLTASTRANGNAVWTVDTPTGSVTNGDPRLNLVDASGLIVSIVADAAGTYVFHLHFADSSPCDGQQSVVVVAPGARLAAYRMRITPPASTLLPQQDVPLYVYGGTPLTNANATLQQGTSVHGTLMGPLAGSNVPIAGEVHLVPQSGPELELPVDATGGFALPVRFDVMYRVVLIPADGTLAPSIVGPVLGAELATQSYLVGAGATVSGTVKDETAALVAGAAIALRAGPLPSSLGVSAANGTYSAHAVAGTYSLSMSKAGWPDVELAGVVVPSGGVVADVTFGLPRLAVTARVVRADGVTQVENAKVTIVSRPLANAAVVSVNGTPQTVAGVVRESRTSLADGTLGALAFPAGKYEFFIEPDTLPSGATEGVTGLEAVISAPGEVLLRLAPRPTLTVSVHDAHGAPIAARVRARPQAGGAWSETTTAAADGSYSLDVAQGVPLELAVDPPAQAPFASVHRLLGARGDPLGSTAPTSVDVVLPAGLPIAGTLFWPSAAPLAGASVDILCGSCGDGTPLAHTDSRNNGYYSLALPDPGLNADAGTQ